MEVFENGTHQTVGISLATWVDHSYILDAILDILFNWSKVMARCRCLRTSNMKMKISKTKTKQNPHMNKISEKIIHSIGCFQLPSKWDTHFYQPFALLHSTNMHIRILASNLSRAYIWFTWIACMIKEIPFQFFVVVGTFSSRVWIYLTIYKRILPYPKSRRDNACPIEYEHNYNNKFK